MKRGFCGEGMFGKLRRFAYPAEPRRGYWLVLAIVAAAAGLAAALLAPAVMPYVPDYLKGYHASAWALQQGKGYLRSNGQFNAQWPPGYSLLIAPLVVEDPRASLDRLRPLAASLAVLWVWLVARIARQLLRRTAWYLVLPVAVLWPPLLIMGNPMTSEMWYAVLITASLVVFLRLSGGGASIGWAILLGLLLGLATLTKTIGFAVSGGLLLAILVGLHHQQWGKRLQTAVLVGVVFLATLVPWLWLYSRATGTLGFTNYPELTYPPHRAAKPPAVRLEAGKFLRAWFGTTRGIYDPWLAAVQLPWLGLFVAASVRLLRNWSRTPPEVIALHGVFGATWLADALTFSLVRLLAPALPFCILAVFWHAEQVLAPQADRSEFASSVPGPALATS